MTTNLERYRKDLDSLIERGEMLVDSIQLECLPKEFSAQIEKKFGKDAPKIIKAIPSFSQTYQTWYSEALVLIKQLLPDRLADFISHYEVPKGRKEITYANYMLSDTLQGLNVTTGWEKTKVVGPDAGIPHFRQQLAIAKSAKSRFESSLFDIAQLVQADIFDSELEAAEDLAKKGYSRAAGALAGVVLEHHLIQVCDNHKLKVLKKNPGISDLNDLLKSADIIDLPQWRFIQHLADIRNLCDHSKKTEPSPDQIADLIAGVSKITKSVF